MNSVNTLLLWEHVHQAFKDAEALRKGPRDKAYNSGGIGLGDYFPYGTKSAMHMVWLKALRAVSCEEAGDKAALQDSLLDLINYAGFACGLVDMERKEENSDEDLG